MRKLFLIICCLIPVLGFAVNEQIDIITLLANAENEIPEPYRSPVAVVEMRGEFNDAGAFQQLRNETLSSWEEIIPKVSSMGISDTKKALLFKATQGLPLEDYLQMAIATMDLWENGNISRLQAMWVLFPSEKHLRNMWESETPPKSLSELAQKAEAICSDGSKTKLFFTNYLRKHIHNDSLVIDSSTELTEISKPKLKEKPLALQAEAIKVEVPKKAPEESSNWLLWLIGALVVLGGLAVVVRRKN
jgi:hypothetical protein